MFDRGVPAEEIQKMKRANGAEDRVIEQLRKWHESEHVLNILRKIRASEKEMTKLEMEAWLRATKH